MLAYIQVSKRLKNKMSSETSLFKVKKIEIIDIPID